jgi:methylated-DNA-[protein]-cysteine S-methyltransferase
MEYLSRFETRLGPGAVRASDRGVNGVYLPHAGSIHDLDRDELAGMPPSPLTERAAGMLQRYFRGERQPFEDIPVDLAVNGTFRRRILELVRVIPFGEVRSYGEVAVMAGSSGAARAVGGAMAANPVPVIIPCHRVVAGDGRLTGFTAPGGIPLKKFLLQLEGAEFIDERIQLCRRQL